MQLTQMHPNWHEIHRNMMSWIAFLHQTGIHHETLNHLVTAPIDLFVVWPTYAADVRYSVRP